ncbi:hypothetical protein BsWGS_12296 [Bradybaena similaris]
MAIFSKPLVIYPTCYELGHCWTPYCRRASLDIATHIFIQSIKIYGTLYLIAGILRKRGLKYYLKRFIPETLRSTVFLTINGTLFISMFCIWRNILGCFFFLTASFLPAYIAAFVAVLCERKSRRGPLALYLSNLAIETGYRMLVERKIVTPINNGEVYLFSAASAVYLFLFRKKEGLSEASESLFRFFLGGEECPRTPTLNLPKEKTRAGHHEPHASLRSIHDCESPSSTSAHVASSHTQSVTSESCETRHTNKGADNTEGHPAESQKAQYSKVTGSSQPSSPPSVLRSAIQALHHQFPCIYSLVCAAKEQLRPVLASLDQLPRHRCCPHSHSCVSYVLKGGARMFSFGYLVQALISTVSSATVILRKPWALQKAWLSTHNLSLAAFLGGYCAVFRAVNCVLRWVRNKDSELHGCVAGAFAGLSLRFYKSVTIALYTATKLMEVLYFKGIQSYGFPHIKSADIFIYAFSTAFILHAAVVEPHTLRPGYWKFLLRITNNRFAFMNRKLLDVFGVKSSKLRPDYWPDYVPSFTSLSRPKS